MDKTRKREQESARSRSAEVDVPRFVRGPISGWGRRPAEICDVYRPEDHKEVRVIVDRSTATSITPRGLGRSYGDASINAEGAVVLSEQLDRLLDFDAESATLHCEAAVSLADIMEHFLPRGFFFPVTPGTKNISVGGAIAADVHGKNHHSSGSMSASVERFSLLTSQVGILECSRESNPEIFWATIGGMGLTGIILDASLRLRPVETAYMMAEYERVAGLDSLLELMDQRDDEYDYSVAWVDSLAAGTSFGRSVLIRANHASSAALPPGLRRDPLRVVPRRRVGVPFTLPNSTLNPLSMRLFNAAFYARQRTRSEITDCDSFFYPLDSIENWNRAYGARGVLQYQCVIPKQSGNEGTKRLLEELNRSGIGSFLTVLKSLGPADDGLLSFPMPGKTLAVDLPYTGPKVVETLHRLDRIVLDYGGRVYLAKDACMTRESFVAMYPRLPEFQRVKSQIDPSARFSSSQARRLGIVGSD
jgi:decaprenylphospho-beta-D-ribofuranose 2-oxidase